MKVKSFYGNSIKDALDKARRELGPDAAIVASRQLRPDEGGGCEVVCGTDIESSSAPSGERRGETASPRKNEAPALLRPGQPVREAEAPQPTRPTVPQAPGKQRVARIRRQIEALVHPTETQSASDELRAELRSAGFPDDLTNDIMAGIRQRQRQGAESRRALPEEISMRLRCAPQLGAAGAERRIVALVGPPGSGKTTALVKFAVRYGLRGKKPMHIISMDSWRVGGTDALRTYAAGMGITFEVIETAEALRQSLEQHTGKGLILIDTPGFSPADVSAMAPLASLLSTHQEADVHLVVPAFLAPSAMASMARRFRPFLPSKLLITNTDCADSCLPAAALALALDKPVSFLSTGPMIPEDIEEATAERLLGFRAAEERKTATSAA